MGKKVPSIGRLVHVVLSAPGTTDNSLVHRPAQVVVAGEADSTIPNVRVFDILSSWNMLDVEYDPTAETRYSWHWPEYVPEVE